MRNDEFYIPVLEAQLAAAFYDQYERIGPQYALDMARQNHAAFVVGVDPRCRDMPAVGEPFAEVLIGIECQHFQPPVGDQPPEYRRDFDTDVGLVEEAVLAREQL